MNAVPTTLRFWALWVAPFALLVLALGLQTDWGREWTRVPPAVATAVPPPVTVTVLPPYVPDATVESSRDTIDRTLFNPTRRPAPVAVAEAPSFGRSVISHAPRTRGARAYVELCMEVMERD